jgi:hypothetical protein
MQISKEEQRIHWDNSVDKGNDGKVETFKIMNPAVLKKNLNIKLAHLWTFFTAFFCLKKQCSGTSPVPINRNRNMLS